MELDAKILYEIALNKALEKEKQLIELMALYQQFTTQNTSNTSSSRVIRTK